MIKFYKPNQSVKGSCLEVDCCAIPDSVNSNNERVDGIKTVFMNIAPQKSWDANKKTATFDYEHAIKIKLSQNEIALLRYCIRNREDFKSPSLSIKNGLYHTSANGSSMINFNLWHPQYTNNAGEKVHTEHAQGYVLSINRKQGEESTRFFINLSFPEAEQLYDFLGYSENRIFRALDAETQAFRKRSE